MKHRFYEINVTVEESVNGVGKLYTHASIRCHEYLKNTQDAEHIRLRIVDTQRLLVLRGQQHVESFCHRTASFTDIDDNDSRQELSQME